MLLVGACGGSGDNASRTSATRTTQRHNEPLSIRDRLAVAATSGAEPIATGEVLAGSTLGDSPFCVGGAIRDTHASSDPAMKRYLIDRTITCPAGTVRVGFTPGAPQALTQSGRWTIVSGTGAFEGLRGSGKMKVRYDPEDDALAREMLTGTVTR
jgi:hypothetical protein